MYGFQQSKLYHHLVCDELQWAKYMFNNDMGTVVNLFSAWAQAQVCLHLSLVLRKAGTVIPVLTAEFFFGVSSLIQWNIWNRILSVR